MRKEVGEGARDELGDGPQAIHEVAVEVAWRSDQAANGAGRRRCSGGWGRGSRKRGWRRTRGRRQGGNSGGAASGE